MKVHDLRPSDGARHPRKRRGRGIAAGQGKTAGYGTKGAGSRSGRGGNLYFEGGQLPLVNRLPYKRGFRNRNRIAYSVVNVVDLNGFEPESLVDTEALVAKGLVKKLDRPVKILGDGDLDRPLAVRVHRFSATARAKIVAAGGTTEIL